MPLSTIVKLLQEAKHVVIFTGAGVSAESGIPTFRDALNDGSELPHHALLDARIIAGIFVT